MPVKNEENVSAGSPVSMNKTKKTRYSLKKLLDRSRFSPRLLRIPRLNKSTDGDQEGDGELKATCFNVEGDLVRESDVRYNLSDCAIPSNRQYAASVPLDPVQHSHSDSGTQTPTGMSEPSDQTPENFVEEEYEESLTQFADLIIEGLKNSPSLRSNQPREVHTQSSSSSLRVRNEPPTSNNAPSLSLHAARFCPPVVNGQLTPPLKFDTVHPLTSIPLQVPALDECAIYNEPCDAKPSPGNNPEDSVTIYTVNLFTPDATEVGCTRGSSKGGSKPMPTRYSATPILIVPNWRTTLTTQPVPCVQRLTKLTAQSPARSGIPSHFQQFRGVPSIRVNFLPAFVSRTNRYTKIYNVRQSLSHLSPRRNISSPITIWTRGPSPPPSIPEEDEYECDDDNQTKEDCTRKITHSPILVNPNTTLLPTARKFPSNGANHTQNVDSSSGPQAPSTPNGVYWPDAPLTSMETGLYEHRLGILTAQDQLSANDSIRVGLYKTKENYDPYWFGSGSDLLLLQSLSRTGIGSAPVDYMDSYDVYYDNPPVVMYSNVHIPVSAYVFAVILLL
ncbi:hypothetical protein D915_007254 [Fasciola hepatica]|uniref:Uncharacterized protein n=1 Tax=Fasciola hepatica TaxID=6192 RepID=A0A4E0RZ06_FASHE|nr:hypothetical protein D915_007254 [Fasciola hepatica]